MNHHHHRQRGASIVNLLLLVLVAYGIYVGILYVPIWLESRTMDGVFDSVEESHLREPIRDTATAEARIAANLSINSKDELISEFEVTKRSGKVEISAHYGRELNLLYGKKTITYDRTLTLN